MVNSIKPGSVPVYTPSTTLSRGGSEAGAAPSAATTAAPTDRFEMTSQAKAVSQAAASLQTAAAPVQASKVAALQQRIATGDYTVNAASVAAKLSQLDRRLGGE